MKAATDTIIRRLDGLMPQTAIVLGSGLGGLVEEVALPVRIPFSDLEGFPRSGVSGHAGEIVAGRYAGAPVVLVAGRVHYYEHGNAAEMRPVLEALAAIGVGRLILTNAAGSLRPEMGPGSVMMITDHINFAGANPLIGEPTDSRFVGMTQACDGELCDRFRVKALELGEVLHEGVYMWFSGPSFETPAEIRAARILGADAVGMSTVPEIILGRFLGLKCAAFSVITNLAAGMTGAELSHHETKEVAPRGGERLARLLAAVLGEAA